MSRGPRRVDSRLPLPRVVLVGLLLLLVVTVATLIILPPLAIPGPSNHFTQASGNLESARNALRTTILQTAGAVLLVLGAIATWSTIAATRRQQFSDQFVRAIELLARTREENGVERPVQAIHIAAVHTLEQIMRSEPSYQPTIVAVLAAYIRQHSPVITPDDQLDLQPLMMRSLGYRQPAVWWAFDALMRRTPGDQDPVVDLSATDLRYSVLVFSRLAGAHLDGSDLRGCEFREEPEGLTADSGTRWPAGFDPYAADIRMPEKSEGMVQGPLLEF